MYTHFTKNLATCSQLYTNSPASMNRIFPDSKTLLTETCYIFLGLCPLNKVTHWRSSMWANKHLQLQVLQHLSGFVMQWFVSLQDNKSYQLKSCIPAFKKAVPPTQATLYLRGHESCIRTEAEYRQTVVSMASIHIIPQVTIPCNHLLVDLLPILRITVSSHGRVQLLEANPCHVHPAPNSHCKRGRTSVPTALGNSPSTFPS